MTPRLEVRGPRDGDLVLVLAHGAGAGSSHPWMKTYATALAKRGLVVVTFDFPYVTAKKKVPDRAPVLEAAYRAVLAKVRAKYASCTLLIGGKSMGGRIASMIAASSEAPEPCAGLVFFGYPLHPPGQPEKRRDAHLGAITAPMLFVSGARDPFGDEAEMSALAKALHAELVVVPEGDHSLAVPKRTGLTDASVRDLACDAVVRFSNLCRS